MTLEAAVPELLAAVPAIADKVKGRIRPQLAGQNEPRPFLTVVVAGDENRATHSGAAKHSKAQIQITAHADTALEAATLAKLVKDALHGKEHTAAAAGVKFAVALFDDQTDNFDQPAAAGRGKPIYERTQTYRVLYRAA